MDTSEVIKFVRQQNALSQQEFATLINVSLSAVKAWENGQRKPSGAAVRLIQLLMNDDSLVSELKKFQGEELMMNLEVNRKEQTIMGVRFKSASKFSAVLNAVANSMYEGYRPTVEDIELYAEEREPLTPQEMLAVIRSRKAGQKRA